MGSAVHRFFPPGSTDRLPRLNFPEAARGSARTEADSEAGPPVLEPARRVVGAAGEAGEAEHHVGRGMGVHAQQLAHVRVSIA